MITRHVDMAIGGLGVTIGAQLISPIVLYYSQVQKFDPPMSEPVGFAIGSVVSILITTTTTWAVLLVRAYLRNKGIKIEPTTGETK